MTRATPSTVPPAGQGHDHADRFVRIGLACSDQREGKCSDREDDPFHFAPFGVSSFAMRDASLSFSIPSTASRNCAAWLRLRAWAVSFSNLAHDLRLAREMGLAAARGLHCALEKAAVVEGHLHAHAVAGFRALCADFRIGPDFDFFGERHAPGIGNDTLTELIDEAIALEQKRRRAESKIHLGRGPRFPAGISSRRDPPSPARRARRFFSRPWRRTPAPSASRAVRRAWLWLLPTQE